MAIYMFPHNIYKIPFIMCIANQGNSHCFEIILFQVTLLFQYTISQCIPLSQLSIIAIVESEISQVISAYC